MLLKRSSWERWKQQQQKLHCGLGAFVENSCYNPATRSSAPKLGCRVWNFCCNSFPSQKLYRRKIYLYTVGNGSPAQLGTDQFADVLMLLLVVVVIGQTGLLQKKPTTNLSRCCCWGLLSSYACGGYENASIAHSLRIVWDRIGWYGRKPEANLFTQGLSSWSCFFLFFQASINWKKFRFFLFVASFFRCCSKKRKELNGKDSAEPDIFFLPRLLSQ